MNTTIDMTTPAVPKPEPWSDICAQQQRDSSLIYGLGRVGNGHYAAKALCEWSFDRTPVHYKLLPFFSAEQQAVLAAAGGILPKPKPAPPAEFTVPAAPAITKPDWRPLFHTAEEVKNAPPLKFAIEGVLQQDGITLIGGLAGHGKTLLMLNIAKALIEGGSLFQYQPFEVNGTAKRIIYLVPESGLGPFVHRLKLFGLEKYVGSKFFCRTLSAKEDMSLEDDRLMEAVAGADVFLDTAVRFMPGDENSAADQRQFANTLFKLQAAGARTITGAHHAPKNYERFDSMTLENTLRGSGDIGAMLATCWAVKQTDKATNRLYIRNVKPRDFEPCEPFEIEGRPYIDQRGEFLMVSQPGHASSPKPTVEKLNRKAGQQEEARIMLAAGHKPAEIAKHLKVAERTVWNWKSAGLLQPKPELQ